MEVLEKTKLGHLRQYSQGLDGVKQLLADPAADAKEVYKLLNYLNKRWAVVEDSYKKVLDLRLLQDENDDIIDQEIEELETLRFDLISISYEAERNYDMAAIQEEVGDELTNEESDDESESESTNGGDENESTEDGEEDESTGGEDETEIKKNGKFVVEVFENNSVLSLCKGGDGGIDSERAAALEEVLVRVDGEYEDLDRDSVEESEIQKCVEGG